MNTYFRRDSRLKKTFVTFISHRRKAINEEISLRLKFEGSNLSKKLEEAERSVGVGGMKSRKETGKKSQPEGEVP